MATSSSITSALGAGSGVDITALVASLTDAQFAGKNKQLTATADQITKQISGVATVKSGITGFSSALASLSKGGTLATAPTSSNSNIVTVSAISGAKLAGLSANIEVRQLAQPQVATSLPRGDPIASVGLGSFTLTFGKATVTDGAMTGFAAGATAPVTIPITQGNSGLTGIARSINAANAGVTATVLTDSEGSRLSIKGATGEAQAFTLTATESPGAPGLSALNIGPPISPDADPDPGSTSTTMSTATIGSVAQDAIVAVDGTALKRSSNSISDLITGVKLNLVNASVGTKVTLGSTSPTAALSQAVNDFVETFNQFAGVLTEQTDPISGALKADPPTTTLQRALRTLTLTPLVSGVASTVPTTLAEIGVKTNRDGTLSVDATRLGAALAKWPDTIEAMFADGKGATGAGLPAALTAISNDAVEKKVTINGKTTSIGLVASTATYTGAQSKLSDQLSDVADQTDKFKTRLTQQYAAMDARVASYKSTLTFIQQQVDAWNSK